MTVTRCSIQRGAAWISQRSETKNKEVHEKISVQENVVSSLGTYLKILKRTSGTLTRLTSEVHHVESAVAVTDVVAVAISARELLKIRYPDADEIHIGKKYQDKGLALKMVRDAVSNERAQNYEIRTRESKVSASRAASRVSSLSVGQRSSNPQLVTYRIASTPMLLAGKITALVTAFLMAVNVASRPLEDRKTLTDIHKDVLMHDWVNANEERVGAVFTGAEVVKRLVASVGLPKAAEGMGEKDATGIEYRPEAPCFPTGSCTIHV
ncbi:hypothetical protein C8J57DRAFT_1242222 [Mycena rebaudengoi]|nr:hypothetical protein C8J57DRAFT_1242222 [Mycena rebaudengoi]